jgi:hypothetical protein
MAIDEQQKEILRKRLELARASKVAKKQKIADVVQAPSKHVEDNQEVEEAKEEPPKPIKEEPPKPIKEELKTVSKVQEKPKEKSSKNDGKEKYAKLVFYKEPSGRSLNKLSRLINNESSDDEKATALAPAPKAPVLAPQPAPALVQPQAPKIDPRILRQQQISNMAKRFFDGN